MKTPKNPKPNQIRNARHDAGLTQAAAAALIYASLRAWQDWEGGQRAMHPGMFELFKVKVEARGSSDELRKLAEEYGWIKS